jgi:hypothetical protein
VRHPLRRQQRHLGAADGLARPAAEPRQQRIQVRLAQGARENVGSSLISPGKNGDFEKFADFI